MQRSLQKNIQNGIAITVKSEEEEYLASPK